jgi:hypothetical protein
MANQFAAVIERNGVMEPKKRLATPPPSLGQGDALLGRMAIWSSLPGILATSWMIGFDPYRRALPGHERSLWWDLSSIIALVLALSSPFFTFAALVLSSVFVSRVGLRPLLARLVIGALILATALTLIFIPWIGHQRGR